MRRSSIAAFALLAAAAPVSAEVVASTDQGFVIRESSDVPATAEEVWAQLIRPSAWWSDKHTYSGDAANLSLDAMAAGCFCEVLMSPESPRAAPRGSVEHMRVVYAEAPRVLRMAGALGPLQSEALQGTLKIALKPIDGGGTRILWEYVVGGFMRYKRDQIVPAVDAMLGEQASRLAAKLGAKASPRSEPAKADTVAPAKPAKPVEGR